MVLTEYTLDIDATGIESQKEAAAMTYKGYTGYMPMVGNLAENGLVVGDEFREGNESPGARNLEFIRYCMEQMPVGKRVKALRADAASYQADIFNFCEEKEMQFAIGADLDEAVVRAIESLPEGRVAALPWGAHCRDGALHEPDKEGVSVDRSAPAVSGSVVWSRAEPEAALYGNCFEPAGGSRRSDGLVSSAGRVQRESD